jgi:hypothetical protein
MERRELMRATLHRHKAFTAGLATFAMGLVWVIPAATAGAADPTQAVAAASLVPLDASYNVAKQPAAKPAAADYNIDWDVAVITPDGTSTITDRQIRDYIEAAEAIYRRDTGKPFNFIVNGIKRGSTTFSTPLGNELAVGAVAASLYGRGPADNWGTVLDYVQGQGDRLLVFAPKNKYASGSYPSADTRAWNSPGITNSGFTLLYSPEATYDQIDAGSARTEGIQATLAHEIGHVFGLAHATKRLCPNAPISATWSESAMGACTYPVEDTLEDYKDTYSLMGNTGSVVTATAKYVLGLLDSNQEVVIDQPVTNQTVNLRSRSGTQGAEVLVVADPASGLDYTFEYRQSWHSYSETEGGDGVYAFRLANGYATYMHMATRVSGLMTEGATFVSEDGLVRVTLVHQYADHAELSVTFGSGVAPAVTIPPVSLAGTAAAGNAVRAIVTATVPSNAVKTFEWYQGSTLIQGATGDTYTLRVEDVGKQVKVRVTAAASGYTTATRDSDPVTVAAGGLWASPQAVTVGQASGSVSEVVNVSTNQPIWNAVSNTAWLSVNKSTTSFTVRATSANNTTLVRTGTITVSAGAAPSRTVTVTQLGKAGTLSLSQYSVALPALPPCTRISVTTDQTSWTWASSDPSWLLVANQTATSFNLCATANTWQSTRSGTITISAGSATPKTVAVTQAPQVVVMGPVSLSGTPAVGQVLTAQPGATTPNTTSKFYQWYRGSTLITSAVGPQYTLSYLDVGQQVKVKVIATATGYVSATAESAPVTVAAATLSLSTYSVTLTTPSATGCGVITVTTNQPTWSYAVSDPTWLSVSRSASTTATTFVIHVTTNTTGSARSGRVTISAGQAGSKQVSVYQPPRTVSFMSASISGTAVVGKVLTANPGSTTPATTKQCQWYRSGVPITGATGCSYTLVTEDAGKWIQVKVTASASGYASTSVLTPSVQAEAVHLSLSQYTLQLPATATTSEVISIMTNQAPWSVTDNVSWLTETRSGSTFTVKATANTASTPRTGTITVSAGTAPKVTITVTQAGK